MSDDGNAVDHEWTKAVAIQTFMRDLETQAMAAYMTNPACFPELTNLLGNALQSFSRLIPPPARCTSDRQCPPGWSCCDGICKQYCNPQASSDKS